MIKSSYLRVSKMRAWFLSLNFLIVNYFMISLWWKSTNFKKIWSNEDFFKKVLIMHHKKSILLLCWDSLNMLLYALLKMWKFFAWNIRWCTWVWWGLRLIYWRAAYRLIKVLISSIYWKLLSKFTWLIQRLLIIIDWLLRRSV